MRFSSTLLPLALAMQAAAVKFNEAAIQYDYIVAGAGAAGLVVAERLAETGAEVLLIERGQPSTYASGGQWLVPWNDTLTVHDVPGLSLSIYSTFDQSPQGSPMCSDTADMAGCTLGGGTEINMMAYVRPQDRDFENWPAGWQAADMTKARSNLYSRNPGSLASAADGKFYDQGAFKMVSRFFKNVGWSQVNMLTQVNEKHNVFSRSAANIQGGLRAGPVRTYLPLVQSKKNFSLMLGAYVTQVVRDGGKVTGMMVTQNGQSGVISLKSTGKAILAAGALSTPRILWYSGIGKADQLNAIVNSDLKVTLPAQSQWIDLPVGYSLRNHAQVRLPFQTDKNMVYYPPEAYSAPSQKSIDQYNGGGNGIFSQNNERIHFWTSLTLPGKTQDRFFQGIGIPQSANEVQLQIILAHGATSTGVVGLDTTSGSTTLATPPIVNTPADREAFAAYLDQVIGYSKKSGSPLTYMSTPGTATGADIIKHHVFAGKHYVGSTKMGTDDGRQGGTAVVDPNTKVYGTDNLYVVDASIHPDLPTGNTMAIVMVAAEQAAMKILAQA